MGEPDNMVRLNRDLDGLLAFYEPEYIPRGRNRNEYLRGLGEVRRAALQLDLDLRGDYLPGEEEGVQSFDDAGFLSPPEEDDDGGGGGEEEEEGAPPVGARFVVLLDRRASYRHKLVPTRRRGRRTLWHAIDVRIRRVHAWTPGRARASQLPPLPAGQAYALVPPLVAHEFEQLAEWLDPEAVERVEEEVVQEVFEEDEVEAEEGMEVDGDDDARNYTFALHDFLPPRAGNGAVAVLLKAPAGTDDAPTLLGKRKSPCEEPPCSCLRCPVHSKNNQDEEKGLERRVPLPRASRIIRQRREIEFFIVNGENRTRCELPLNFPLVDVFEKYARDRGCARNDIKFSHEAIDGEIAGETETGHSYFLNDGDQIIARLKIELQG